MRKTHNFYAGPAILAEEVKEQAAAAAKYYEPMGLSILEVSHRSKEIVAVVSEAQQLTKELLGLSDDYYVLFLTGGASTQFLLTAMNLLETKAAYVDTGVWSQKAIKEGKMFGQIDIIASSEDKNYSYIPKNVTVNGDYDYLHYTSNNTIYGTQFKYIPETNVPLVCDMSSDIFSKPMDYSKFDLIYAGAQKNLGPAGTTLVIVRKDILGKVSRQLPTLFDYRNHIKKDSMLNTGPVYPIYVCLLTLRWLKKQGGLQEMAKRNEQKAAILYDEIDRNSLFTGIADKADRSLMNVSFVANDKSIEETFLLACEDANCVGIKGHRSVGGFRASIYNAMPQSSVEVLVDVMKQFEKSL